MTLLYNVIYSRLKRQPDSRRNGSFLQLRPLGRSDGRLISSFVSHLTPDSTSKRFLSQSGGARHEWVANLINADQRDFLVYGAVAINQFGSSLVAMAESIRDPGDRQRAEFALAAVDPWQNMGIGTLLTGHVARIARSSGVSTGTPTCRPRTQR
jgi:hypothetical protein